MIDRNAARRASMVATVAAGALLGAAGGAAADTVVLQSLGNGRLVSALPLLPATATGSRSGATTRFERSFLGNGYAVLRNPATGLCLEVRDDGTLTETALRDGRMAEQFRFVAGTGGTTLQARANNRFVAVASGPGAVLKAGEADADADATFAVSVQDAGQPAAVALDPLHAEQSIVGFGGALVFNEARLARHPYQDEIFHLLFDPEDGLGITFLRIGNNYGITEAEAGGYADYNPTLVGDANRALGSRVSLIMSGWGPPPYLKNNGSATAGTLRKIDGQYDYAGYARWWADSIVSWRQQGIDPDFVSIQNEPEVIVSYISNHFNPQEDVPYGLAGDPGFGAPAAAGYGKALDAVSHAFAALPSAPLLLGPEVDGPAYAKVEDFLRYTDVGQLAGIAHHLYDTANPDDPDSFSPDLRGVADAYPDKPKFMTEWLSNDAPIVEAEAIHDTLVVENLNAYIKWSLANSATVASAIYDDDGTQPPSTWKYPHGYAINDNYYVMKHYAYYVRPGFRRIDSYAGDPDLRVSAFVDPKPRDFLRPRATVVALNVSATRAVPVLIRAPAFLVGRSDVRLTAYSGTQRWAALGSWKPGTSILLPPNSILTVAFNPR